MKQRSRKISEFIKRYFLDKDFSELLKNYVTILAIIGGGLWAIFTFTKINNVRINDLTQQQIKNEHASKLSLEFSIDEKRLTKLYENKIGLAIDLNVRIMAVSLLY